MLDLQRRERKKKRKGRALQNPKSIQPSDFDKIGTPLVSFFQFFMICANEKQTNNQKAQSHTHTHKKKKPQCIKTDKYTKKMMEVWCP